MKLKKVPKSLVNVLQKNIFEDDLTKIYKYFSKNYDRKWQKSNEGFYKSDVIKINPIYRNEIIDLNGLIGIDLPTLFESKASSGKLMILAQDPLRSAKDFKHEGNVIIGTPYALQSNFYRDGSSKLYYHMLLSLMDLFKEFYLTDVAKVYAEGSNIIGMLGKSNGANLKKVLASEINVIMPDTILAMGNIAQSALDSSEIKLVIEKNNIQRVDTPHIRAHHNAWLKAGAKGSKNKNKLEYIFEKIVKAKASNKI